MYLAIAVIAGLFLLLGFLSTSPLMKTSLGSGHYKRSLVMFYSPNCPACKRIMPVWQKLQAECDGKGMHVFKVNCLQHRLLADKHGINRFPTIKYLKEGIDYPEMGIIYEGDFSYFDIKKFYERFATPFFTRMNPNLKY